MSSIFEGSGIQIGIKVLVLDVWHVGSGTKVVLVDHLVEARELPGGGGAAEDGHVAPELLDAFGLPAKGLLVPCGVVDFHFLPDAEAVRPRVARGVRGPPDGGEREA
eukprot:TRINITY_DN2483_c0_g1_i4.p3 TRINITY_DN2483_c0_g1~~TRINITY_DN2483_c0_g1_i4.p3  ORF type:complete len:107 (-),score=22.40 TRINITY_DN2483_c0_g1_i4:63-383(-)